MRYFFFCLSLVFLAGCKKTGQIEFTGITPGITSGTFIIKNLRDSTMYGTNIKDGKFTTSGMLMVPGYYTMDIVNDADKSSHDKHYEVYLESGKYIIETDAKTPYNYPKITSPAKTQDDLSAYYKLVDQQETDDTKELSEIQSKLDKAHRKMQTTEENIALENKLAEIRAKESAGGFEALKLFVKQNSQSAISAHLMFKLEYEQGPVKYNELYKAFSPEAKNSDDGKELGDKLGHLVKLVPGAQSPALVGQTPDGKPFDPSSIKKKVILIDFWRAVNQLSRLNHRDLLSMLNVQLASKDFGVVSVSIDSKNDWWQTAITEDKMTWTQVSDLKGDDSQNAANWAVSQIPTYYLVDGNWKIIARDIQLAEVPVYVNEYLEKH